MPNWVDNTLTIRGNNEHLKKFKEQAKGISEGEAGKTDLCLNNFLPLPKELENTTSPSNPQTKEEKKKSNELIDKYGVDNWYDWKLRKWGTKWDVEAELWKDSRNVISYRFSSAWSPPIDWLKKVSSQFPELKFKLHYSEGGMCFRGDAIAENGTVDDRYEDGVCDDMEEELDEF